MRLATASVLGDFIESMREPEWNGIWRNSANFKNFQWIEWGCHRKADGAGNHRRHGVKPRISLGSRINAQQRTQRFDFDSSFFFELAHDAFPQRFTPLERTSRQCPISGVAPANEHHLSIGHGGVHHETAYRPSQQVPCCFFDNAKGCLRNSHQALYTCSKL